MYVISVMKEYEAIRTLWNEEMGFIFPISEHMFQQNALEYEPKRAYGAYEEDTLVGFILGKSYDGDIMTQLKDVAWISLFYVSKKHRRRGIGSSLLHTLEKYYIGKKEIFVGRDVNNFFPGVPCDFDNLTDDWFLKRGYTAGKYTHDLINLNCIKTPLKSQGFDFREARISDSEALQKWILEQFSERWHFDCYDYFAHGGTGKEYVLAFDQDQIVAFAKINDQSFPRFGYHLTWHTRFNALAGIGPLGVDRSYRGKDLGYDIVAFAINTLIERGKKEIMIDWTGILEFYQQFNFEVWKSFKYMSKKA